MVGVGGDNAAGLMSNRGESDLGLSFEGVEEVRVAVSHDPEHVVDVLSQGTGNVRRHTGHGCGALRFTRSRSWSSYTGWAPTRWICRCCWRSGAGSWPRSAWSRSWPIPTGFPVWTSPVEPGSVDDITAGREHVFGALYKTDADGVPTLADMGYVGAGIGIIVPFNGRQLAVDNESHNALQSALRAIGERADAILKGMRAALQRVTLCPNRIGGIVAAAAVLAARALVRKPHCVENSQFRRPRGSARGVRQPVVTGPTMARGSMSPMVSMLEWKPGSYGAPVRSSG